MGALISAPIAAVGSCLGSCLGAAACTACCKACSCRCTTPPRVTNTLYVALMVIGAATAMILRVSGLTLSFGANVGINGATTCFNAKNRKDAKKNALLRARARGGLNRWFGCPPKATGRHV